MAKAAARRERPLAHVALLALLVSAVVLLAATPSVEASRYLPASLTLAEAPALPHLEDLDQVHVGGDAAAGQGFALLTDQDLSLLVALARPDPAEVATVLTPDRYRLFPGSTPPPRRLEQLASWKIASGGFLAGVECNVLGKQDFTPESWWTLDTYAFVGWGPHRATDPLGTDGWTRDHNTSPALKRFRTQQERERAEWCRANPQDCAADRARAGGLFMMGGAVLEGAAALSICGASGGLACLGSGALLFHSHDTWETGMAMWRSGAPQETRTFRLFEAGYGTFLEPRNARTAARYTEILVPAAVGAGMARSAMSAQARAPALILATETATGSSAQATSRGFSLFGRRPIAQRIMQRLTTNANAQLAKNPALARQVLSRREYAAGQRSTRVAPMQYGNAEERMAAQAIEDSFMWDRLFEHVGGPSNPDFIGRGIFRGLNFDITTPAGVEAHLARPGYGNGLIITTYERPQSFRLFPEASTTGGQL